MNPRPADYKSAALPAAPRRQILIHNDFITRKPFRSLRARSGSRSHSFCLEGKNAHHYTIRAYSRLCCCIVRIRELFPVQIQKRKCLSKIVPNSQNGTRTHDTAVNSRALYQLSYPGKTLGTGFEPATDRLTADCSSY